jgi:hypothetical protein
LVPLIVVRIHAGEPNLLPEKLNHDTSRVTLGRSCPSPLEIYLPYLTSTGDGYSLLLTDNGAILKGFAHESPMSPWGKAEGTVYPGVLDAVPHTFKNFSTEPAFQMEDTTFCFWRQSGDSAWHCGQIDFPKSADPDGSEQLMWALDGDPETYCQYARDYFEIKVDSAVVNEIFRHVPLDKRLTAKLNRKREFSELKSDAEEIGYPLL